MERRGDDVALPHEDGIAVAAGENLDALAAAVILGARMKTASSGASPRAPGERSVSLSTVESSCRPYAFRSIVTGRRPRPDPPGFVTVSARRMAPAQVPSTGSPRRATSRIASSRPVPSMSFRSVVDSPPGITRPSDSRTSSAVRTGRAATPARARAAVRLEVALQGEDADHGNLPAAGLELLGLGSFAASIPCMPSPRPSEAFATRSASSKCVVASTIARARCRDPRT